MKVNRKGLTLGLAGLGLIGVLAGGAGLAQAAGDPPTATSAASTISPCPGHGEMRGTMAGRGAPMTAAAKYLGLSLSDLQAELRSGKSLADIADAQGKSVSGLKDTMLAAMKQSLDANTTLTTDQKAAMLARMRSHLDTMVTTAGMFGHMSGAREGMMGNGMMRSSGMTWTR